MNRTYLCIDLKSFYASVECMELGLDPLTTNLVVADESRTEKTICLAVEKPKFMHKYGYYEICCKLPKNPGWHAAFCLQAPESRV